MLNFRLIVTFDCPSDHISEMGYLSVIFSLRLVVQIVKRNISRDILLLFQMALEQDAGIKEARNPELSRYTKPNCWNLHASPLEISYFLRFWEPAMGKPIQSAEIHVQNLLFWGFLRFWRLLIQAKKSVFGKIQKHQQILLLRKPETQNCLECACIPPINELS